MKKLIALFLSAAMLLTFAACAEAPAQQTEATEGVTAAPQQTEAPVQETAAETEGNDDAPAITPMGMEQTVLVDDENCTFTITAAYNNEYMGAVIHADCVNKTDRTLTFSWNGVSVCGYMYDPLWAQEVAGGGSVESVVYIDTYDLEQLGVTSVDEIEFTLMVADSEDFMAEPLVNDSFTIYPTGLTAQTVVYPERANVGGEQLIADNDDLSFIIESAESGGSFYTLRCYLRNKTEKSLMYSWDFVTVNGCAIDPLWAMEIAPGKQAYAEISFPGSDLTANGIENVEEVAFTLLVSDWEDWEAEPVLEEAFTFHAEDSVVG